MPARRKPLATHGRTIHLGQSRRFGDVRVASALPLKADIHRKVRHVSKVPILLQKSFWGDERKFSGALTRVARGYVRDHVVPRNNDHGPAERRDGASQRYSSLKITFRAVFGGV